MRLFAVHARRSVNLVVRSALSRTWTIAKGALQPAVDAPKNAARWLRLLNSTARELK